MIDIHIWGPKKEYSKKDSPFKDVVKSYLTGGGSGHASLSITMYGNSDELDRMKDKYQNLSFVDAPPIYSKVSTGKRLEGTIQYERGERMHGITVTNSFVSVEKVTKLALLKNLLRIGGKSKSGQRHLNEDMQAAPVGRGHTIQHAGPSTQELTKLQKQKENLIEKYTDITEELTKLRQSKDELSKIKETVNEVKEKQALLEKNNYGFWRIPEEMPAKLQQLKAEYDTVVMQLENLTGEKISAFTPEKFASQLEKIEADITHQEKSLPQQEAALTSQMEQSVIQLQELNRQINRVSGQANEMEFTEGSHPTYSFSLPSSAEEGHFHLNEKAILEYMEQQKTKEYDAFGYNCSHSVKDCVLHGMSEEMQAALKEAGAPKDFFKLNTYETPVKVQQWLSDLNKYIHVANANYLDAERKANVETGDKLGVKEGKQEAEEQVMPSRTGPR